MTISCKSVFECKLAMYDLRKVSPSSVVMKTPGIKTHPAEIMATLEATKDELGAAVSIIMLSPYLFTSHVIASVVLLNWSSIRKY